MHFLIFFFKLLEWMENIAIYIKCKVVRIKYSEKWDSFGFDWLDLSNYVYRFQPYGHFWPLRFFLTQTSELIRILINAYIPYSWEWGGLSDKRKLFFYDFRTESSLVLFWKKSVFNFKQSDFFIYISLILTNPSSNFVYPGRTCLLQRECMWTLFVPIPVSLLLGNTSPHGGC